MRLKKFASRLRSELNAVYTAARDPRTPWYAKALALAVVAYALSPIDLIPDFIPVLGYLDDLILIPLGIALAIKLIPRDVLAESRARQAQLDPPPSRIAAMVIIMIWLVLAIGCAWWLRGMFFNS